MTHGAHTAWAPRLRWLAFMLIVSMALLRATAFHDPFPGWEMDPLLTDTVRLGLGPGLIGMTDLLIVLGALVAIGSCVAGRERLPMAPVLGLLAGAVGVSLHGLALAPGDGSPLTGSSRDLAVGVGWMSAVAGGVGIWIAGREPGVRALAIAIGIGAAGAIAVQGLSQVFVEHPETVRLYEETRDSFLAARGWTPDSPQALAYERRLNQPDVTGWFAMANPAATFLAAAWTVLAVIAIQTWHGENARRGVILPACLILLAVLGAALWLTQSNAGRLLPVIGLGMAAAPIVLRRRARAMVLLPLALTVAIVVRGVIGERLGELSVLFRAFYLDGAWRVWLSEPVFGVGPDGFQTAYLLVRGPLAVEEVASPHHAPAAWLAALGVFGLGFVLAVGAMLWRAEPVVEREPDSAAPAFPHRMSLGIITLVSMAGMALGWEGLTPEGLFTRLAGVGLWLGMAWVVWTAWGRARTAASAGILAVLVVHGVFDVTPTWISSAPLYFTLLGAAIAAPRSGPGCRIRGGVVLAGVAIGTLFPATLAAANGIRLESALSSASREIGQARRTIEIAPGRAADELARARAPLAKVLVRWPEDDRLRRAVGRLTLQIADASRQRGELEAAVRVWAEGVELTPHEPGAWIALSAAHGGVGVRLGEDRSGAMIAALVEGMALDPRNLQVSVRLARLEAELGRGKAASEWAARALENDAGFRLDPLKRLPDPVRAEMESLTEPAVP